MLVEYWILQKLGKKKKKKTLHVEYNAHYLGDGFIKILDFATIQFIHVTTNHLYFRSYWNKKKKKKKEKKERKNRKKMKNLDEVKETHQADSITFNPSQICGF